MKLASPAKGVTAFEVVVKSNWRAPARGATASFCAMGGAGVVFTNPHCTDSAAQKRHTAESPAIETHYYLSSSRAGAAEFGRLIRNHWSLENQCQHLLDVTYHENHCQVRDKAAAHNLTLMRELSTKVLKTSAVKGSIRSKRKRCALNPACMTEATHHIFHGFGA